MTMPAIRVLLAEDVPSDAELEVRELKRAGLRVEHRIVGDEVGFRRELREFSPDVVLSDFSMPYFDGMAALALARDEAPEIPFIFVSGTIGEEYAIRALKNGATDYVLKSNLMRLPATVERALQEARERAAQRETERALKTTRERLESIFQSLPDVVWSVTLPARQLIYVSPAVAQVYGRTPQEALAKPDFWVDAIHPGDRARVMSEWPGSPQEKIHDSEYRIVRPDGAVRWINVRRRIFMNAAGVPERVDGLVRDITEQMEQRQRLARLSRIRELASAVNAAIVRLRERQALFEEFSRIAIEVGGFRFAHLVELDRASGRLRTVVVAGAGAAALNSVIEAYNSDPPGAKSLLAAAIRTGKAVVANDVTQDDRARLREWYAGEGIQSVACLPLGLQDGVAGAVILNAGEKGFFDDEEMRLLGELTGNLSFALELIDKQAKLDYLAYYDPLTELPNRTLFRDRLAQAIEAERRGGGSLALVLIDLERFKAINDALGQHVGDRVLQAVARRLQEAAGDIHRVARLGGNLFALMFPGIRGAEEVARRIEQQAAGVVGLALRIDAHEIRLAAKEGIAVFPDDGENAAALLRNAEAALKRAKETGERYLFYAPHINARVAEQVELESRLRRAVEQRELFFHYQPKIELDSRRIVGLEALIRWRGPDNLPVSPARFVPVLEETGMILEAGRQALESAGAVYREWKAQGLSVPRIAVNVSALQLRQRSFVDDVRAALGGPDNGVDLEITESLLMEDIEESIRKLRALREAGANIALDDFGTGHSSLAYLSRLPIDTVKIDGSFIHAMTDNADATSIVSTIISLAQALRLKVVAEGVETEEQARLLRLLRCDQMQGYLFSPPLAKDKIETLLRAAPG
jgi:diguanylate cyclase (GGDEF)-like protein/PAS domain S-box-containing protein